MNTWVVDVGERRRWDGLVEVVRFNWPRYALALAVVCGAVVLCWMPGWPGGLRVGVAFAAAPAVWWTVASLVVTHWVYDRSELRRWVWLREAVGRPPARWMNVHAGFDETTGSLSRVLPGSKGIAVDLYHPSTMTESSIHRARGRGGGERIAAPGRPDALPVVSEAFDAAFVLMAAHELRCASDREALFGELWRCVCEGGRVVVVEHLRNGWNFAAYGPGFTHFYSAGEWRRLGRGAGFVLAHERGVTRFVRCFVFRKGRA